MKIAKVLIENPISLKNKTFDYDVNGFSVEKYCRVRVDFNNRLIVGIILELRDEEISEVDYEDHYGYKLKKIVEVIDQTSLLNEELLLLANTMSKDTVSCLVSCLSIMLPKALKIKSNTKDNIKYGLFLTVNDDKDLTLKQKEIIQYLKNNNGCFKNDLIKLFSIGIINTLIKKEKIKVEKKQIFRKIKSLSDKEINHDLSIEQKQAIFSILNTDKTVSLLHGITGSGKTEVYVRCAQKIIEANKNVIILVPEISLTPQMVLRFKSRFKEDVAILHSKLSDGEKYDEYQRIKNKKAKIVVGTRSAIFAPLSDIGLIVVDEEHDSSYKQDNNPRYNAKDIALFRAKYHQAKVIFASASPLLESYARALKGVYNLVEMKKRATDISLPQTTIIDMKEEMKNNNWSLISRKLKAMILDRLNKKEQVILLINRRGYSPVVKCRNCNTVIKCLNCDVSMNYHKSENVLKCHYCGNMMPLANHCPKCNSTQLKMIGNGSQKIEEQLQQMFKGSKILRMDNDTTSRKDAHQKIIEQFSNHEADILVGTQMISKGLDFENVTLVGVIDADLSLFLSDFRCNERTFELILQVSGRSGRHKKGEVVIQTSQDDHYALTLASKHDYLNFFKKEMQYRKLGYYPPYCYIVSLTYISKSESLVLTKSNAALKYLKDNLSAENIILGPTQMHIFKVRKEYRMRIIIKYRNYDSIYPHLVELKENTLGNNVRLEIDNNPMMI